MKYLIPVLAALFFTGCATSVYTLPDAEKEGIVQKTYTDYSKDELFTAVINVLTDEGWIIDNSDRETGLITTDWQSGSALKAFLVGNTRNKVSARVTDEGEEKVMVFLNVSMQSQSGYGGWTNTTMTKDGAEENIKPFFELLEKELNP